MNILVIGAKGKMGSALSSFLLSCGETVLGVDVDNRFSAENFNADVVVDFSCAGALKENLMLAERKNVPLIIATTGHTEENKKLIKKCAKNVPILVSANFSLQFNVLLKILGLLVPLKNQDFVLAETHHKHKLDAPSGSAKMMQEKLKKFGVYPSPISLRVGEIVGTHSLSIFDDFETLTLTHKVEDRKVFCKGCYLCCKFIKNKPAKLYSMDDVLNESL